MPQARGDRPDHRPSRAEFGCHAGARGSRLYHQQRARRARRAHPPRWRRNHNCFSAISDCEPAVPAGSRGSRIWNQRSRRPECCSPDPRISMPVLPAPISCSKVAPGHAVARLTSRCRASTDERLEQLDLSPCASPGSASNAAPLCGPQSSCPLALIALELVGDPQ